LWTPTGPGDRRTTLPADDYRQRAAGFDDTGIAVGERCGVGQRLAV